MSDNSGQKDNPWWRHGVIYQIYPRSFADGNGDGTGDLAGVRSKLGYLQSLNIDAIWLNPWYLSPLADGGYDVADYRVINPIFGTTDEAATFIKEAHEHGLKVIADVVPNHTSDQHIWFQEAISSPIGHPSRNRYHILPGKGENGDQPPNNWVSVFGGPAWTRLPDGHWYLHLFAAEQPDLNWKNPEVQQEFIAVLRFWLDRGIDGFRVDVAHGLIKADGYPDIDDLEQELLSSSQVIGHPHWDQPGIHPIVQQWRSVLDGYEGDRMMVAEAWVHPEQLALYLRPDEYHQSFNFSFLASQWRAKDFRQTIKSSLKSVNEVGSTSTWVFSNHDVMRTTTRYGLPLDTDWRRWPILGPAQDLDPELGARRARAAALLLLGLPGSAYVYQGEELGLPEFWDIPVEVLDDPVWEQSNHEQKGRDGCRVPIPWHTSGESFGFSSGQGWLPQPSDFGRFSPMAQDDDPTSTLNLYRRALQLRREHLIQDEDAVVIDNGNDLLAFRRGNGVICAVNFGDQPEPLISAGINPEDYRVLIASDIQLEEQTPTELPEDSAIWLEPKG